MGWLPPEDARHLSTLYDLLLELRACDLDSTLVDVAGSVDEVFQYQACLGVVHSYYAIVDDCMDGRLTSYFRIRKIGLWRFTVLEQALGPECPYAVRNLVKRIVKHLGWDGNGGIRCLPPDGPPPMEWPEAHLIPVRPLPQGFAKPDWRAPRTWQPSA